MLTSIVALCLSAVVSAYHVGDGLTPGNVTAAGRAPEPGITVACERSLPLGTRVFIDGLGERVCHDRMHLRYEGGAMNFDAYAHSTGRALRGGGVWKEGLRAPRPPARRRAAPHDRGRGGCVDPGGPQRGVPGGRA